MPHAECAFVCYVGHIPFFVDKGNGFTLTDVGQRDVMWRRSCIFPIEQKSVL